MIKLHTYYRSSASYRVRIALNLKHVEYQPVFVHLRRAADRASLLRVNPQGLLPVLEDDGVVLTQSLAIIEYLDLRYPAPRLLPTEPIARARVQAFAQAIACETHPLNNLRVLEYLRTELDADEAAIRSWYQHWVGESFAALERLVEGPAFCCGNTVTLADVCLVPQVYNARRFGCDLSPYPKLCAVAARLERAPEFASAAPEAQPDAEAAAG